MSNSLSTGWHKQHAALLERAKEMKAQPVVDRGELVALQTEIRDLERRIDRPLPVGTSPIRHIPGPREEPPGRAPRHVAREERKERRCPFGRCDGSGWHLDNVDVASPCECQRLPRDREARRQSARVLRRHLALGLNSPPLSNVGADALEALREFSANISDSVEEGCGLWFVDDEDSSAPCAFLAGEALRRAVPVLFYPGDELLGRLRRLAATSAAAIDDEIFGRLADIDLLVLDGLDAAASPSRFPERPLRDQDEAFDSRAIDPEVESEPYEPGMTDVDASRLALIINERLMNRKATVVSTRSGRSLLEENFLHLPGPWSSSEEPVWDEPRRRIQQLGTLLSRLTELCGSPLCIRAVGLPSGSVRPASQSVEGDIGLLRAARL